jgi:hypothetical protein
VALSGTLKDFGISDILQLIGQQQKTGRLRLQNGDEEVEVLFSSGSVIFASEKRRDKTNLLGSLLIRAEMLTAEQLEEALRQQQRTLKRLGDILIHLGLLSEMQMSQLARLQATETLYRLFNWKSGTYEFVQEDVDVGKPAFEPLRAESILLEGFRRMDEWPALRKKIPSKEATFERIKAMDLGDEDPGTTDVGLLPLDASGDANNPGERHKLIFRLAQPGRKVEKIADLSRLGEFEAYKDLEQLMAWGYLKLIPPEKRALRMPKLTGPGQGRLRAIAMQIGITAACLLGALALARMLLPSYAGEGPHPARIGSTARVLSHGQLLRLESALEVYKLETGEYPDQLARLVEGRIVTDHDLRWPFRSSYHYRRTSQGFVLLPPLD